MVTKCRLSVFASLKAKYSPPVSCATDSGTLRWSPSLRGEIRDPSQPQRRDQIARAVQRLNAALAVRVRVGIFVVAHTATRCVWFARIRRSSRPGQLRPLMGQRHFGAGKAEAVNRGVGVINDAYGFLETGLAAIVDRLAEKQHSTAIGRRLLAQKMDAEVKRVQNGGAGIALVKVGKGVDRRIGIRGEVLFETGLAIEGDHCDAMGHIADDRIQHCIQIAVVAQVRCTVAAGLHDHGQRQRLCIGILLQSQRLGNAVIGEDEIVGGQREYQLAALGLHQRGHEHQVRAHSKSRDLRAGRRRFTTLRAGCYTRE